MRLTKKKLLTAWRGRKQIITNPVNESILKRYEELSSLFDEISKSTLVFDAEKETYTFNGTEVLFKDGTKPSVDYYFSCKTDAVAAGQDFDGIYNMCAVLPDCFTDIIKHVGCMLGGFTFDDSHTMKDEFRIISNSITEWNDNGSLDSIGQECHPSPHFADNNYFFNVINTIKEIADDSFKCDDSKLVLRWPNAAYYKERDDKAEVSQKETLRYRFPYKFFFMWTHNVLHPVSLLAYRNLVQQEDGQMQYSPDRWMNQDIVEFVSPSGWAKYSEAIMNMIPEEERGDDFWNEMSKLISVIMIQDQEMKNSLACCIAGHLGKLSAWCSAKAPKMKSVVVHYVIIQVLVVAATIAYVEVGHDKGWKRADVWYTCLHTHHHFPWQ